MEENEFFRIREARSEKQMEAFKNTMKKRAENIEKKKHEKLIIASELLVKNHIAKPVVLPKVKKQIVLESSESEEEIIIVKSK